MVLGPHLVCGTKNANDMGMVLSKHWRYSTWCSCITGHFIQAKLWYHPSCNWGHQSFGQSPMVWNGHCRDSASISSGGLQLCIFPCSWLQWDCDCRIYLLYLLLKFGLWYVVVLSNLTTFAQGYASFASLELMPWLNHPVAASSDAPRGVGFPNFEFHHCGLPRKPKVGKVYGPWGIAYKGETDLPNLFHYNFLQKRKIACLSQLHHRGKPPKSNKATKTGFLSSVEKRTQLDHVGPKVNKYIYITPFFVVLYKEHP